MDRDFSTTIGSFCTSDICILDIVCSEIFGENKAVEVNERCTRPVNGPFGERTSAEGVALGAAGVLLGGSTPANEVGCR